jgi:hypothetical protein
MPSGSKRVKSSKTSHSQVNQHELEPNPEPADEGKHSILDLWKISETELTHLVNENPSLRGMLLGYVAELKLRQFLEAIPEISDSMKHDDHDRKRKSDRIVIYKGEEFSLESKSLQTNLVKKDGDIWRGRAQVDGSDRRIITFPDGTSLNTTLLLRGQFDILAVNCFAFEQKWCFAYALNRDLPTSNYKKYTELQRNQLIASLVPVSWPPESPFVTDPVILLEKLLCERSEQHEG